VLDKSRLRSSAVLLIAVASALSLAGCAAKKAKPDLAYIERPVDQLYAAGAVQLDQHHWNEGVQYFKEVERQHPYSEWSRRAIMMQAYAHYESNNYEEAVADANRFIELYPGNPTAAYAYYIKAECYFEEVLDVGRDQAASLQALSGMREVVRRFPHTEYAADARLKIDMINDQLGGKEMTIGRYYLRAGDTISAIGRFKTVVDKYQTTSDTPEALYRLVEAYLTLGVIDEAKRNAAVLGYNFPGDPWYADAYKLMDSKGLRPDVVPTGGGHGLMHRVNRMLNRGQAHDTAVKPSVDTSLSSAAAAAAPAGQPAAPDAGSTDTTTAPAPAQKPKKKGIFSWLHIG
jgi:outer membrane protein assembly factor BamD